MVGCGEIDTAKSRDKQRDRKIQLREKIAEGMVKE